MKITFIFIVQLIILCLPLHDTEAALIPHNNNSKIYLMGNTDSYNHLQYVFHNETDRSWSLYKRGPCGELMWIEPETPQSANGVCNCIQTPLGLRQLVYWQPTNRCYFVYDQGPCETKQWLNYNNEVHEWQCQTNPCPSSKLEKDAGTDIASLIELETDYYLVSNTDNTTCLRNRLKIKQWHLNFEDPRASRFLFHIKSNKFFPEETKGACPTLMKLVQGTGPAEKFGACRCREVGQFERPVVYWKKTNRCYVSFTQGPCASGEWIVSQEDNFGEVSCKKHNCTVTPVMHDDVDYEKEGKKFLKPEIQFFVQDANGTCQETNTTSFCTNDKRLFLKDGYDLPDCYHIDENGHPYYCRYHVKTAEIEICSDIQSLGLAPIQDCDEGYQWDENFDCVKISHYS